ncbi:MAG TPA: glycine--tRNA ligase subunit beta [Burkholderiales bacterium]|nr:glycine--tRNA ligase subunit beta [Burkholderiales bacterium]
MPDKKTNKLGGADTLLVELLTEELPPKALKGLSQRFCDALVAGLEGASLLSRPHDATPSCFATPRRLAVSIPGVLEKAADVRAEKTGPSVNASPDAVKGFAGKCGVPVDSLVKHQTAKGEVWLARYTVTGAKLDDVLVQKVSEALKALPIPKLMRWGDGNAQFARPAHGLMMLHGSRVIAGDVLGVSSSNKTLGHRFFSGSAVTLKHAGDYEDVLSGKGKVITDFAVRRADITKQLEKAADGATLVLNDALLDEITAIVEAPAVYAGEFSPDFLAVPEECLILSMQQHQKYVPLRDKKTGKLLPRFLFVSNIETKQPGEIIRGNERVLRARLADAKFFYDQDRKTRLEARVPRLASVVYHNKLGSQLERVERIQLLAGKIARELGADPLLAERAAWLSKADLLTDMVGEFPELQGVMGRYYALNDGEPKAVADAIGAHYRPRFAGDALPDDPVSASVALAEKLDALAGLFGIGQVPTGDRDPFGLRRAALGVIRILVERNLPLPLNELVNSAFSSFNGKVGDAHTDIESFIYDRFSGYLKDQGYSTLEVESVISKRPVQINLVLRQIEAVRAFNRLPEAGSLAAANKRVVNILKQAEAKGESFANVGCDELKEPAEKALFEALATASQKATPLFKQGDFTGYLKTFAVLKAPVDAFFDSIMVMAEDPALRRSRLALLADLRNEMNRVADISKLAT